MPSDQQTGRQPILLCDLDDVVFRTSEHMLRIANRRFGESYDLIDLTARWATTFPEPYVQYIFKDLFPDPDFYTGVEVFPQTPEAIEHLRSQYRVLFVTAGPPSALPGKVAALLRHGILDEADPFFPEVIGATAKDVIAGEVLIDDSPRNIRDTRATHRILRDAPWNRSTELPVSFVRSPDWTHTLEVLAQSREGMLR